MVGFYQHSWVEALRSGRHVVTANKTLMGAYGERLVEKARQHDRFFGFSASVTGFHQFVPSIVKSIMIEELVGIFNGTTNFILTKLAQKPFEEVLQEAIALGYAEADHHNDTEGFDTANKLVIASKLAFGVFLDREDISVSGIRAITKEDVVFARELGYAIKLLGISRIVDDNKLTAFVCPALVPLSDPLARVDGVDNSILVDDRFSGIQGMSAAGAGKEATAKAIFSDLISIGRGEKTLWPDASVSRRDLKFTRNQPAASYYVRADVANQTGVLAKVSKHFARNGINIINVIQRGSTENSTVSIIFMLAPTKQRHLQKVLDKLAETDAVVKKPVMLRIERSSNTDFDGVHAHQLPSKVEHESSLEPVTA